MRAVVSGSVVTGDTAESQKKLRARERIRKGLEVLQCGIIARILGLR